MLEKDRLINYKNQPKFKKLSQLIKEFNLLKENNIKLIFNVKLKIKAD